MKIFLTAYNNEAVAGDATQAAGGNDIVVVAGGADELRKVKYSQVQVNEMLAEDRRKHKAQVDKTVQELESVRKSKSLTDKDRETLQLKIDELQNSLLTKEELAIKEREKLEKNYKTELDTEKTEKESWKTRFTTGTINTVIVSEAVKAKAFDPDAIISILGPDTRLVQDTDSDGKPLEAFVPKVKFKDTDKDGKAVTLDLTVEQAIKRMKEIPKHGYLFENTATPGLGGRSLAGGDHKVNIKDMTPAQYREHRKTLGLGPK